MFSSHLTQTVHLVNPEYPKVFTNFENQVGEYSVAYKRAKSDFKIIAKLQKNAMNYDLIIQYNSSGVYDVLHFRSACHITETYGYGLQDCIAEKKEGDTVKEGDYLYKAPNYDEEGNFGYGVNLKAAYLCWKNLTYEDAVVVSESAAKKLTSYLVDERWVSVNGNDILLNLYDNGEYHQYHSFPHVGEETLGTVLTASRREDRQNILYNFQYDKMKKIEPNDDITYTHGGKVVDIDIYCNTPVEILKKSNNEFIQEVVGLLESQNSYFRKAASELEKILPVATESELQSSMTETEKAQYLSEKKEYGYNWARPQPRSICKNRYTEEFGYFWKQVHEYLDGRIQWRSKGKSFQNFKMKFTILKENPLQLGSKITGRYGNKGVVSCIEKDEDMPITEDGVHADVCLNSLGVLNRMNVSQLQEVCINFMSDHVVKIMKGMNDAEDKLDLLLSYLKYLDKEEHDFIESETILMSRSQKEDFIKDIEDNGIFVHQTPYFKNAKMTDFVRLVTDHPEWATRYKCKVDGQEIEKPIVIGDLYFIRSNFGPYILVCWKTLRAFCANELREKLKVKSKRLGNQQAGIQRSGSSLIDYRKASQDEPSRVAYNGRNKMNIYKYTNTY